MAVKIQNPFGMPARTSQACFDEKLISCPTFQLREGFPLSENRFSRIFIAVFLNLIFIFQYLCKSLFDLRKSFPSLKIIRIILII